MRLLSRIISSILCVTLPLQAMAQDVQFIYRMSVDGRLPEGNYSSVGDYTPDAFNFFDKTNVLPGTAVVSDPVTISGIDTTAGISIQGGCYLLNDEDVSACHAEPGTLAAGDSIRVRLMASPSWETTTQARLSIGGVSDSFSVRTRAEPVSVRLGPDADGTPPDGQVTVDYTFDFATLANVDGGPIDQPARSQELIWNIVSGQIPEGLFFSGATGLLFGEPTTAEETTFSVSATHPDGASDDEVYTVTIAPPPNAPDAFAFTALTGVEPGVEFFSEEITLSGLERAAIVTVTGASSARFSVNGGALVTSQSVQNGDRIRMRVISPNSFGSNALATLEIGQFSAGFSVTVRDTDQAPDAFSFVSLTDHAPGAEAISTPVTLSGFEGSVGISVSGLGSPTYSVNNGPWTAVAGTVSPGDSVRVKLTAGAPTSTRIATLTVGGVAGTFSVSTAAEDGIPDLLAFDPVSDASESILVASTAQTVSGINVPVTISVTGEGNAQYRINSGAWTATAGSVRAGDLVSVRLTSGPAGTTRTATLLLASIEVPFSVTTVAADTMPDAFAFSAVTVAPAAVATTGPVILSGFDGSVPVAVSGHASALYSLDGVTFTAEPGTVSAGAEVWLRVTASATEGSVRTVTLTAGSGSADFAVTSQDITPNVFTFAAVSGVDPGAIAVSNDQTISSITGSVGISIAGQGSPEYRINGGAWTSSAGSVLAGDIVAVRLTAGAANISRTATLTVGGRQGAFSVTARPPSTTPDAFTFTSALVAAGAVATAGPVTLTGFQDTIEVSVSGDPSALFSLDGVTFTSTAATVSPGDQVWVRGTASASEGASRTITLTAGTGSAGFVITTQDKTPDAFTFAAVTDAEPSAVVASGTRSISGISGRVAISVSGDGSPEYSINGGAWTNEASTVMANDFVAVRLTSGAGGATQVASLTIGNSSFSFSVTARLSDTTPDAFTFTPVMVAPGVDATSAPVTLIGFEGAIPLSLSGDSSALFSLDGTNFTSTATTVTSGQQVWLRITASATENQARTATLTAGSGSAIFTVTAQDLTPSTFSFTTVNGAEPGALTSSGSVTLASVTGNVPVSISGSGTPAYRINGGAWTSSNGTIQLGDTLEIRLTADVVSGSRTATVTVGTVSANFVVNSRSADTVPDAFNFTSQTVDPNTVATAGPVTLTGFDGSVAISVSSGQYSLNGTTFTSTAGTVSTGQQVWVRGTSPSSVSGSVTVLLTVGSTTGSFTITSYDVTPNLFSFAPATNVQPSSVTQSSTQVVNGITNSVPISISGSGTPEYRIDSGSWTSTAGTVLNNSTVAVRLTSGAFSENRTATLTVGTQNIPYSVTTRAYDTTPDAFPFTTSTGVEPNTLTGSNTVTVTGLSDAASVSVSGEGTPMVKIAGGAWTATPGTISNGQTLQVRLTSASGYQTSAAATVTVGGVTSTYTVTTRASDPCSVSSPTIGTLCTDGTRFAGYGLDNSRALYATSADIGAYNWNNGFAGGYTQVNISSMVSGQSNTNSLILADSNSGTTGVQPHLAAQACYDLVQNGYSDWYLPATSELGRFIAQTTAMGLTSGGVYWTSTEAGTSTNYAYQMTAGSTTLGTSTKATANRVRCVRQGAVVTTVAAQSSCEVSATIGETCGNGGIRYAGLSGSTGSRSYVTPVILTIPFNAGDSSYEVAHNQGNPVTGSANSAVIAAADSQSNMAGSQPNFAAKLCEDMNFGGYSDWYLPATAELSVLNTNRTALGLSGTLWSSTEFDDQYAWTYPMGGSAAAVFKYTSNAVACMRKEATPVAVALGQVACDSVTTIGGTCGDGRIRYAGMTQNTGARTYVTDVIQNGPWNSGDSSYETLIGTDSPSTGAANTTTIAAADAQSLTTGTQIHMAARLCQDLVKGGYTDWYLPSSSELMVMTANRTALGLSGTLWSSTEFDDQYAYAQTMGGTSSAVMKYTNSNGISCMRQDAGSVVVVEGQPTCENASTIGQTCGNGEIRYAGLSGSTGARSYTAPASMAASWNSGSSTYETLLNQGSHVTGAANTAVIAAADAHSLTAGTQVHMAAATCDKMVFGGYSDWYLPSTVELAALNKNRTALGLSGTYWSSTEYDDQYAWTYTMGASPSSGAVFKYNSNQVQCMRQDATSVVIASGQVSCDTATTVGQTCGSGSIRYAGLSSSTGARSFATEVLVATPWNSGDSSYEIYSNQGNPITGAANTSVASAADAQSLISGVQVNNAARLCSDLVQGGYTDWYLPGSAELTALNRNRTALGLSGTIWSSTEYDDQYALLVSLGTTTTAAQFKYQTSGVVCMRQETTSEASVSGQPACDSSVAVGATCGNGQIVRAGNKPTGGAMFTTNFPMLAHPWNSGDSSYEVATGATSDATGSANTATIAAADAQSQRTGVQINMAARLCQDLVFGGFTDWYLPATNEGLVLSTNRTSMTFLPTTFWTSTESATDTAKQITTATGAIALTQKYTMAPIQCVR